MSPRYVKQRDQYSCAPIALLNLCKWAGINCAYGDELHMWIKEHCGCKPREGSPDPFINATLLALGMNFNWAVRFRVDVTVKQIQEELEKGNGVLVWGEYGDGDSHMALLTGYSQPSGFEAVNWFLHKRVTSPISLSYMRKIKRRGPIGCWFIRRK